MVTVFSLEDATQAIEGQSWSMVGIGYSRLTDKRQYTERGIVQLLSTYTFMVDSKHIIMTMAWRRS
jgi:hypothetical protein